MARRTLVSTLSLVADVVDESGIAVDRQQVRAQLLGQEPQGDREVLGVRLGEHCRQAPAVRARLRSSG